MNLDSYIFNKINGIAKKSKQLDWAVVFFAKWLPYIMAAFLFGLSVFIKNINVFWLAVLAGIFARYFINEIVYCFYKRKRPPKVAPAKTLIKIPRHPSFPSGHTSFLFGLSFMLLYFNLVLGGIFLILSFIIGFSRVIAGVHWLSDILAGIVVGWSSAVFIGYARIIDFRFFNLLHKFNGQYKWLDYSAMFFAQYFEYVLWLALVIFLAINFKKYWKMVVLAFVSAGISKFIFAEIVRLIWFRQRPFLVENFIPLIKQSAAEASFPSGHASFYFALSTIVYIYNKKAGILFYAASVLITVSRVYVGVHWPTDILAGAVLGIITAHLLNKLFKKYENYISWSRGSV